MPIYEYKCTECNHEFEELIRNKEAKINCPKCKTTDVRKKMSKVTSVINNSSPCERGSCPVPQGSDCSSGCCPMA